MTRVSFIVLKSTLVFPAMLAQAPSTHKAMFFECNCSFCTSSSSPENRFWFMIAGGQ